MSGGHDGRLRERCGDGEASTDERASTGARRRCRPTKFPEKGRTVRLLEQRPLAFRRECACKFEVEGKDHGHSLSGRSDTSGPGLRAVDFDVPMDTQYTDRCVYYGP